MTYSVFKVQFSKPSIFRWGLGWRLTPRFLVGGKLLDLVIYR